MNALVWPLLLLALGTGLLLAEAFIPSGGALLILAVACFGLGLWRSFAVSTELGLKFLLADAVVVPATAGLGLYLWQKSPLAARMTLRAPAPEELSMASEGPRVDHLVGERGRTLTPLRPSGFVDFDGRRLESVSEEGLIPEDTAVRAVAVRSGRLVVRQAVPRPPDA